MAMRTVGIDLSVNTWHKAIVANADGHFITPLLKFRTHPGDLAQLVTRASEGTDATQLQAVMEPTGMAWFPIAVYLIRQGVTVYVVKPQQVADLRRFYSRHAKSDLVDAQVLAKIPLVNPEHVHKLYLPSREALACQRACKQLDKLTNQITAIHNRIQAADRFAWTGLEQRVFAAPFSPAARWFRHCWYHPGRVVDAGVETIAAAWIASQIDPQDPGTWVEALVALATDLLQLYGTDHVYLDFDELQREMRCEQDMLLHLENMAHTLRVNTVRPLYRLIHPSRLLETMKGVGQDSAAVYASFIGEATRFPTARAFRGWSGMVPNSEQSADSETKGLHITQAGPSLIKKYAYLDADVARRWDPQIAAIYYDQIVHRGKHHNQAVCTCATHLLDRVHAVLREGQPYELRDVDGTPVTWEQARAIIAERYTVPAQIRQRRNKRVRRDNAERRVEGKQRGKAA
jgi:transposase